MRFWIGLLLLMLTLTLAALPVMAQTSSGAVSVYYIGPQDNVLAAIRRAAPHVLIVDNPELAQVFVLNDPLLEQEQLQSIGRLVLREEVGLVLFLGPRFPRTVTDMRALLGVGAFNIAAGKTTPQTVRNGAEPDPLQTVIAWNSAPEIQARSVVSNPNLLAPVVATVAGEPLVQRGRGREQRQVFVVGAWFADPSNALWADWPYFDYFIYRLLAEAAAVSRPIAFADYPRAPVPQGQVRWALSGLSGAIILVTLLMLFLARRDLFLRPQRWRDLQLSFRPRPPGWREVGFHRPLAGLLLLLGIGPVLLLPWLVFQLRLLPQVLLPWSQALSFWEQAGQWLGLLWLLFDAGIGAAAVWYLAAWRVRDPKEGLRYIQLYIWWQMLSGAVQVALLLGIVNFILLQTPLAYLAFYVIARAILQFPGFLLVFRLFFRAEQRFDYEQRLTVLWIVGAMVLQTALILGQRALAPALFDLTPATISILMLGLALYITEWLVFGLGLLWYRRLGYTLYALFIPAFDWGVLSRALRYGIRWAIGPCVVAAGALAQGWWLARWLPDFAALQAVMPVLLLLITAFELLQTGLFDSLMPALVEALTQEARTLVRYYLGQGLRYGLWTALPLLAVMALIGEHLDAGWLEGRYTGITPFLGLALTWAALQWPAWMAERLLEAEGRPGLRSVALVVEQGARWGLIVLLAPRFALPGLWAAMMAALLLRTMLSWLFVRRWRVRLNLWQMAVAPAGAALVIYNIGKALQAFLGPAETAWAQLLWFGALLLLLPVYGFLTGLLGGWDDAGLKEFHRAVQLSDLGLPLTWFLWGMVRLGAHLSPLHGAFPMALQAKAHEEAQALSMRRPIVG